MRPIPFRGPWLPPPTATRAAPEYVVFTMRCPGCGQDATCTQYLSDDLPDTCTCTCELEEGAA